MMMMMMMVTMIGPITSAHYVHIFRPYSEETWCVHIFRLVVHHGKFELKSTYALHTIPCQSCEIGHVQIVPG